MVDINDKNEVHFKCVFMNSSVCLFRPSRHNVTVHGSQQSSLSGVSPVDAVTSGCLT